MVVRASVPFALVLSIAVASGTSCVLRGPAGVRREIAAATGAEYEREFGLTLGRTSLALARWGLRTAEKHDPEGSPDIHLAGVRKVQIGVYEVEPGTWRDDHEPFDPAALGSWEPIVRVQSAGEDVHVLLRTREGRVREMLVVVSEADELVIIRMKGRLERMLHEALRYGLEEAGRDELYAPLAQRLDERGDPA
jgi:hypothetical protein